MDKSLRKKLEVLITNTYNGEDRPNYLCVNEARLVRGTGRVLGTVEDEPEDWDLNNRQAKTLLKLSHQLGTREMASVDRFLKSYCQGRYRAEIIFAIVLYFVHAGKVLDLLSHLKKTFTNYDQPASLRVVDAIAEAMLYRPDLFTDAEASHINDWCQGYLYRKNRLGLRFKEVPSLFGEITASIEVLGSRSNEILTRNFEKQVDLAFNPDLNTDEQRVRDVIEEFGFPLDLAEALDHIENQIRDANTAFKYKNCMDSIRAFTERLFERIAKEIDPQTKVDGKDSEAAARFFKENKLLSGNAAGLLVALRHFLSNDGVHRLKSKQEDARIAKNLVIELSLYLLTRLRELKQAA
jgi:hypothetical protein